tara:strand:+ start:883 stop:1416 length:534 start_codon:yes stop_codon:yes gene_type:complete
MALSEERKKTLAAQKKRAMMKEIDNKKAAEAKKRALLPYRGVNAKRALRKASKQNEKAAFRDTDGTDLDARLGAVNDGEFRDLLNIERYGDDAMRSRAFGSTQPAKKMGGGMMKKPVAMGNGGKMPMVKKGGKSVPSFAADGVGKMSYGGKMPKKMNMGGKCRGMGAATRGGNFKMG